MDSKTLAELQKLSRRWKRNAKKERNDFFSEAAADVWLSQCAKELDDLIEKATK